LLTKKSYFVGDIDLHVAVMIVDVVAVAVRVYGRHGFGHHGPPCGRCGHGLGLSSFVAIMNYRLLRPVEFL